MKPIPIELWIQIFKLLSKKDWISLSRTCAAFNITAQSMLYANAFFEIRYADEDSAAYNQFARSITERPSLTDLVHVLSFLSISPGTYTRANSSNPVILKLNCFSNLHYLRFVGISIDANIHRAIQSLPHLIDINLCRCRIDDSGPLKVTRKAWGNPALELSIIGPLNTNMWNVFIPAGLRTLRLVTFKSHMAEVMLSSFTQSGLHNLATLHLDGSVLPPNFIPFLMSCPQLRRISLPSELTASPRYLDMLSSLLYLPPQAIPLLEDFAGSADYAEVFIKGRPVHTVTLFCGTNSPVHCLRSLQLSLTPVTELRVSGQVTLEILQHAPPSLRLLRWGDRDLLTLISWLPTLSKLRHLHTLRGTLQDKKQRVFVLAASVACNSLREVVFEAANCGGYNYVAQICATWRRRHDGTWTPS